ncbi:MAG: hypothetical protein M3Q07_06255 [Pseudobdellovibrionaceae bacterium]|nr:hypothetical protein [Pseudobdellovibrionaceae bacterium]
MLAKLGLVLLGLGSMTAWAQDAIPQPTAPTYRGLSEENRQMKRFGLWGGLGFRSVNYGLAIVSAEAAYFLAPDAFITVRASHMGGGASSSSLTTDPDYSYYFADARLHAEGQSQAISYQYFLGNSFFVKAGLENLNMAGRLETFGLMRTHIGDLNQQNALLGIGNQWQWRSFTLGCEWIGAAAPLSYSYSSYDNAVTHRLVDQFIDSKDQVALNLLYFHLGAAF